MFGPDSLAEAGIAIPLPAFAPAPMIGRADRLVVRAETVTVVDFKTDAAPPGRAEDVPPAYLAQLGAYRAALAACSPGGGSRPRCSGPPCRGSCPCRAAALELGANARAAAARLDSPGGRA